uniref:Leucine carboxyl methyltransferase 1 n=1 Tax=Lynceus sp. MCZ IZ 141354 TaxID=1930659 RepID=A0A9N6ZH85_9CRUS|nr:EOG090X08O3 [Lynceus sp. MCZ IZ 141354]
MNSPPINVKPSVGDEAIRATNDDASSCKRFAIEKGYWIDPFLPSFIKSPERKPPEINRGYFARVYSIKQLIDAFFKEVQGKAQIINLGAGFDTLFWRLKHEDIANISCFIDVDFPTVTSRKCHHIKNTPGLLQYLHDEDSEVQVSNSELHSHIYHIIAADLRNVPEFETKINQCQLDYNLPTLILTECVLVYMKPSESNNLLKWMSAKLPTSVFINYEQVNMKDKFGEVMLSNLNSRGCGLPGIDSCASLKTQIERFTENGWDSAKAWDMNDIYSRIPRKEIERIEKLEFLDERELLQQLFFHYCIAIGYRDSNNIGLSSISIG